MTISTKQFCLFVKHSFYCIFYVYQLIDSSQLQQSQGDYFPFTSGTRENSYQSSRSSEDGHTITLRPEVCNVLKFFPREFYSYSYDFLL